MARLLEGDKITPVRYPAWGVPKIREKLRREYTGAHFPAISMEHALLDRSLGNRRERRRSTRAGTELSRPTAPNGLWCADYRGEFRLGNGPPGNGSSEREKRIGLRTCL